MSVCDLDQWARAVCKAPAPSGRTLDLDETSDQLERLATRIGRDPRLGLAAPDLLHRIAGLRLELRAALAPHLGSTR